MQSNLPDPTQSGNISNSTNDNQNIVNDPAVSFPLSEPVSGVSVQKEVEPVKMPETSAYEENVSNMEIAPELEQIGVEVKNETIDLPPDMQKMGVTAVGMAQPVMSKTNVKLPISDDKIVYGMHQKIWASIYWLALWCVRQLKKGHQKIKTINGQAVRVNE